MPMKTNRLGWNKGYFKFAVKVSGVPSSWLSSPVSVNLGKSLSAIITEFSGPLPKLVELVMATPTVSSKLTGRSPIF